MAKKYFWLKLEKDFFRQRFIKKLRRMPQGDRYTIICLELYLLSIENEGVIIHEGLEETIEEELALALDERIKDVQTTFAYLEKQKLVEKISEAEFLFPAAAEAIGSESQGAERVRRFREKNQALHCNSGVTNCNTEKSREEKEKSRAEEENSSALSSSSSAAQFFLERINPNASALSLDEINVFAQTMPQELIILAMQTALDEQKTAWSYIRGILRNWQRKGYSTSADVAVAESGRSAAAGVAVEDVVWMREFL